MAEKIVEHNDIIGQTINSESVVANSHANRLKIGKVTAITPKMVKVKEIGKLKVSEKYVYPKDCAVITDNPHLIVHLLSK